MSKTGDATPIQRQTRQRSAVAAVLEKSEPFRTAQQVYDELRETGISVGLTTVYRTLASLAESGELDVVRNAAGELTYRRCTTGEHHHHLVCRSCGKTAEISGESIETWARKMGAKHGFRKVDHDFELFGLCADCPDEPEA